MCGLTGYFQQRAASQSDAEMRLIVAQMGGAMSHRGPNAAGVWVDASAGVALGHQRLAVQDLSAAGRQPMVSSCGRYVIALNGEIYNHLELRNSLESHDHCSLPVVGRWRGHSDTESLIEAIAAWGVEETLKRCVGMFAFALWDRETQVLILARDRFGEKPLYYGWLGRGGARVFAFASELKAMRKHPEFDNDLSREALAQYLRFRYVPSPLSIYENIFKLDAGCLLKIARRPSRTSQELQLVIEHSLWWSFSDLVLTGIKNPITSEDQAIKELERCLSESVRLQCISDVPSGAFLSGGVDSSTVVALMQAQSPRPIKTFTIGLDEIKSDESPMARAVALHLGTDHDELCVTSRMAQDVITQLPHMYDEPFADSSQIPTFLVCRAARRKVTVALSGDAGDELFGGYSRHFWGPRMWRHISGFPFKIRKQLGNAIYALPLTILDAFSESLGVRSLGEKAHKVAAGLKTSFSLEDFYWSLVSEWQHLEHVVVGLESRCSEHSQWMGQSGENEMRVAVRSTLEMLSNITPDDSNPLPFMFLDTLTYLSDDILCKVDRAAMASSLETRVPFLDHRVVELAWRLPMNMKIRGNTGKWALRQVLYKYVPKELIERPKAGFAIPIGQWLRGPLRDWAEDLLSESRLNAEGYFYPKPIRKAWAEHLTGRRDNTSKIWSILMFQAWLQEQSRPVH